MNVLVCVMGAINAKNISRILQKYFKNIHAE
jgi:predicted Zn-dependent peptidase